MEKLVENLWKYQKKQDSNKLLDTMLSIKLETKRYTGNKINIDKEIDKAEIEIRKRGGKFSKNDFAKVRRAIKEKEKKARRQAMCLACYLKESPPINFEEYKVLYNVAQSGNKDENNEEQNLKDLPIRLTIGVTMILAGGFLCIVGTRVPVCMDLGKQVAAAGVGFAIEGYVNKHDENKDKEKDKNK